VETQRPIGMALQSLRPDLTHSSRNQLTGGNDDSNNEVDQKLVFTNLHFL